MESGGKTGSSVRQPLGLRPQTVTKVWGDRPAVIVCGSTLCFAQEQYPPPLTHTPADHPAARVLLLSIDGLHAVDLANWVTAHPHSALAELSVRGVTYTNAHAPMANEVAGLLALTTGGTPISTGIVSNEGYDHALSPAGSKCEMRGAKLQLDTMYSADGGFDGAKALRDPAKGCAPLALHDLLRVNTIFEVVSEKIGPTAWAERERGDDRPAAWAIGQRADAELCADEAHGT